MKAKKGLRCALTGHRDLSEDFDGEALRKALDELLEAGYTTFCCGMARGFDLYALSYLVERKEAYHVCIEAYVPYIKQEDRYPEEERELYRKLITQCDVVHVCGKHYFRGVELVRDKQMVEKADLVLAYLRKDTGGTYYTVKYAEKAGIEVRYL